MYKVAIVGCGGMGNGHARAIGEFPDVEIVGVCDLIQEKAESLSKVVGGRVCTDFHDLLDDADVVWDCTPPLSRPQVVIDSALAGKHIFSEKPIALSTETADRMIEAIDKAGITFMTDYVLRFVNPYKLVHEIFDSGQLGALVSVWTRRYMPVDMRGRWFGDQTQSGGVALDFASHDFDQLQWFGGKVKTVFGCVDRIREGVQADEHVHAMMLFEKGMGTSDVSWWAPAGTSMFGVVGTKGSIIADGSGKLRMKIDGQEEVLLDGNANMETDVEGNIGKRDDEGKIDSSGVNNESVQEHFFRCLRENLTPLVTAREARAVLEIALAVQESARTGKSVDL